MAQKFFKLISSVRVSDKILSSIFMVWKEQSKCFLQIHIWQSWNLLLSEIFAIRHWKTASSPHKFFKWFAFLDDSKSNIFLMCPFKISSFSSKLHKYKETTTFCCMVILNVYYFSSNFLTSSIFFYFLNMKYWIRKSSNNSC